MKEMKMIINNIGLFQEKNILKISDLTLICGMNDSGKSTINKILYMLIKMQTDVRKYDLFKEVKDLTRLINQRFSMYFSKKSLENSFIKLFEKYSKLFNILLQTNTSLKSKLDDRNKTRYIGRQEYREFEIFDIIRNSILHSFELSQDLLDNSLVNETISIYINLLKETLNLIFNNFNKEITNIRYYDILRRHVTDFEMFVGIMIEHNYDQYSIYKFFLKNDITNYIENIFGSVSDLISKFNIKEEKSFIYLKLFGNEINIILKDNLVEIKEITMDKINLEDVTYCEGIVHNFINNSFSEPINEWNPSSRKRLIPSFDFYLKMRKRNLNNRFEENIMYDDEDTLNSIIEPNKNEIEEIIKYILKITCFEEGYSKKEHSYKKYGKFINEKNISKGISTFQAIIEMLKAGIFKKNAFVILDEVENFLHPNMQNEFVKILLLIIKKTGCKIIITTHSAVIVDSIEFESRKEKVDISYNYLETNAARTKSEIIHFDNSIEISKNLSEVYNIYE